MHYDAIKEHTVVAEPSDEWDDIIKIWKFLGKMNVYNCMNRMQLLYPPDVRYQVLSYMRLEKQKGKDQDSTTVSIQRKVTRIAATQNEPTNENADVAAR
jgi:hypothetical protein